MSGFVEFETPENVQIAYQPAGLGTRFVAWFVDVLLIWLLMFVLFFGLMCLGIASTVVARQFEEFFGQLDPNAAGGAAFLYFIGVMMLVWGIGSFLYYTLFELLMRGQTPGKRGVDIRVVKVDGFSLDAGSILIRNLFRVVDNLPPLWIVPLVNSKSQRLGDIVAGTVVVATKPETMSDLRSVLGQRSPSDARFRFDAGQLKRLRPQDIEAIERILERWASLKPEPRQTLLDQIFEPLVRRLQMEPPDPAERLQFLEDLLAAEYRRQYRKLG